MTIIQRTLTLLLALTLILLPLTACGGDKTAYRDDMSADSLSDTVLALIPVEGGYDMLEGETGENFLKYYFDFDGRYTIDTYAVAASAASSDVNEYGIIHVNDPKQVAEVEKLAKAYLENQRDFLSTFVNTYNAAEMAKLESAAVRVFGNYVVFTLLSEADTEAVMSAVEQALAE